MVGDQLRHLGDQQVSLPLFLGEQLHTPYLLLFAQVNKCQAILGQRVSCGAPEVKAGVCSQGLSRSDAEFTWTV